MKSLLALLSVMGLLASDAGMAAEFRSSKTTNQKQMPLKEIWAYQLPGTKDIEKLASDADGKLLHTIFESWHERADRLKYKDMSRPGFAVQGSGIDALKRVHKVFVEDAKPTNVFLPDEDITLVFFSEIGGNRVHIKKVERQGTKIVISYQLEPYPGGGRRYLNLALIPLGKLPAGNYRVGMRQLPRDEKYLSWGFSKLDEEWSGAYLCRPFSFTVSEMDEARKGRRSSP